MTTEAILAIDDKTKALFTEHLNGNAKDEMVFVNTRDSNNRAIKLVLECEALGSIIESDFGQSVLCRIVDSEQVNKLIEIEEVISATIPNTMTVKEFLREDRFFLKLGVKDGKYKTIIDPPANPSTPEKSAFTSGASVQVECKPNMWINFGNGQAGIFLQVNKITVDGGKRKSRRR